MDSDIPLLILDYMSECEPAGQYKFDCVHDIFSPVDELVDYLHPRIELVQSQDVLLREETQSRALSKILPRYKQKNVKKKRQNFKITSRNPKFSIRDITGGAPGNKSYIRKMYILQLFYTTIQLANACI